MQEKIKLLVVRLLFLKIPRSYSNHSAEMSSPRHRRGDLDVLCSAGVVINQQAQVFNSSTRGISDEHITLTFMG
jgi:hypothetical protein